MNSVPLTDALPWDNINPPCHGCCIVITDSVETDGRFLLHTLAAQYLSCPLSSLSRNNSTIASSIPSARTSSKGTRRRNVLWVSCESYSERNILSAMKKIGTTMPVSIDKSWEFISVCDEMSTLACSSSNINNSSTDNDDTNSDFYNHWMSLFVKDLFQRIKHFVVTNNDLSSEDNSCENKNARCCWLVVLDDVFLLSQLLGNRNVLALIQRIRSIIRSQGGCLAIRTCNKLERDQIIDTRKKPSSAAQWVGAGGDDSRNSQTTSQQEQWAFLPELADGIIDVMPLPSGFSREAHGKLLFTENFGGKGWNGGNHNNNNDTSRGVKTVFNYFCGENDVKALHMRSKT